MAQRAKLFMNGRSQAVRLPVEFRFNTEEVFIRRDPETGDVVLSARPTTWDGFLEALAGANFPEDFLDPADRAQGTQNRDPFADWTG